MDKTDDLFTELGYRLVASVDNTEAQRNLALLAAWTHRQQDALVESILNDRAIARQ